MHCSKRSAVAVPDDILVGILSRVSAKSLCQFQCVSKAWRDLIDDPCNRKKLPQAMQGLFYSYTTKKISELDGSKFSVDYFSFVDLRTARSVPVFVDPCFSYLMELPGIQFLDLLDSCNGLILFANRRHRYSETLGYIVCNPTTKQWQDVPTCGNPLPQERTLSYLAFDPALSPHFQLVQFEATSVEKFTSVRAYSSEMGTWSHNLIDEHGEHGELEGWHHQVIPSSDLPKWSFVNGILHLIVWDWNQDHQLILAVDVRGKTIRMITVPGANVMHRYVCYIGQSQGCLHCITQEASDVDDKSYKLSIWVLQDYDTQEWVLKDILTSLQLLVDKSCGDNMADFRVVDIHQDCDVVFFALSPNYKLIAYNMVRKEVSIIATFEPNLLQEFARYVPYFSESPALTNKQ
ncbi:hypothetical protein BS78_02G061800 [Paspalum vaginatum]|nr:hypothetical protein BS78_02G061800 [Paspalum vaginatum]